MVQYVAVLISSLITTNNRGLSPLWSLFYSLCTCRMLQLKFIAVIIMRRRHCLTTKKRCMNNIIHLYHRCFKQILQFWLSQFTVLFRLTLWEDWDIQMYCCSWEQHTRMKELPSSLNTWPGRLSKKLQDEEDTLTVLLADQTWSLIKSNFEWFLVNYATFVFTFISCEYD